MKILSLSWAWRRRPTQPATVAGDGACPECGRTLSPGVQAGRPCSVHCDTEPTASRGHW